MRAQGDPDAPASAAERLARVKAVTPGPQLFPMAPFPAPAALKRLIADPLSVHPIARNWMAFAVKDLDVSRAWTFQALSDGYFVPSQVYGWELASTDLTDGPVGPSLRQAGFLPYPDSPRWPVLVKLRIQTGPITQAADGCLR